jgi:hypothetical protein
MADDNDLPDRVAAEAIFRKLPALLNRLAGRGGYTHATVSVQLYARGADGKAVSMNDEICTIRVPKYTAPPKEVTTMAKPTKPSKKAPAKKGGKKGC